MSPASHFGPALTLGIDTSTVRSSVCLAEGRKTLASAEAEELGSAEALTQLVASVCREAGREPGAIELIAVNLGPGSFTGLRTGLASAYGLSLGWGRPVRGVSAFAARLAAELDAPGVFRIRLKASREEYFWTILEASEPAAGGWTIRSLVPAAAVRIDGFEREADDSAKILGVSPRDIDAELPANGKGAEHVALAAQFTWGEGPDFQHGAAGGGLSPLYIKAANAKTLAERRMKS